jgi:hypothetical protein
MLLVSGCDGPVMFDFAEDPLDCIAQFVELCAEGRVDPIGHGFDVGDCTALCQHIAQSVGVIGAVGQKDIACIHAVEHIGGAASVVGLARRDLEQDRQTVGIDQRVDLGRQPAS